MKTISQENLSSGLEPNILETRKKLFHVKVFWVMTPRSVAVVYQRFGEPRWLHLRGVSYYVCPCT